MNLNGLNLKSFREKSRLRSLIRCASCLSLALAHGPKTFVEAGHEVAELTSPIGNPYSKLLATVGSFLHQVRPTWMKPKF